MVTDDYFGDIDSIPEEPFTANRDGTSTLLPLVAPLVDTREIRPMTVPALPRRVCLTRQTSSPLPVSTPHDSRFAGRVASQSITSVKAGRAAKEEQMFAELGYLAPPNPPDELERRRALYK
jgi:hypothetical protein